MTQKKSFERKHFFINRKLQGRYMLTFFIPMIVMLFFLLFTLYFAAQSLMKSTTTMIKKDIEQTIAINLQDRPDPSPEVYKALLEDIRSRLREISTEKKYRRILISSLLWVFGVGIFIVIVQVTLLTIFFSHKLAGPIYRLERACNDIIDGNYTEVIKLRKGDEMINLAEQFNEVVAVSRQRLKTLAEESDPQKRKEFIESMQI